MTLGYRPSSSSNSGAETQRQEKCSFASPENYVSRGHMGLSHNAGTVVSHMSSPS